MGNGRFDWSTTAADNDDADSTVNWAEGQYPSTVNNSARAMMASDAKWAKDVIAGIDCTAAYSGGSSTYVVTGATATGLTSYVDGMAVKITVSNNVGDGSDDATLNLDSVGAKRIRKIVTGLEAQLATADMLQHHEYNMVYKASGDSGAGAWILHNPETYVASSGDWVPDLRINNISTGITYATQVGKYRDERDTFELWGRVVLTSKGANVGAVSIGNLPQFAMGATGMRFTADIGYYNGVSGTPNIRAFVAQGGLVLTFVKVPGANLADTDITNTFEVDFHARYRRV